MKTKLQQYILKEDARVSKGSTGLFFSIAREAFWWPVSGLVDEPEAAAPEALLEVEAGADVGACVEPWPATDFLSVQKKGCVTSN